MIYTFVHYLYTILSGHLFLVHQDHLISYIPLLKFLKNTKNTFKKQNNILKSYRLINISIILG